MASYRIPMWSMAITGLGGAAGAIYDKPRRNGWLLSTSLGLVGMVAWNLYVEAKTIESVVEQGYIYGQAPVTGDEEGMSGYQMMVPVRPQVPPPRYF